MSPMQFDPTVDNKNCQFCHKTQEEAEPEGVDVCFSIGKKEPYGRCTDKRVYNRLHLKYSAFSKPLR